MLVDKCERNGVLVEDGGCLETRGVKVTEPTEKKKKKQRQEDGLEISERREEVSVENGLKWGSFNTRKSAQIIVIKTKDIFV